MIIRVYFIFALDFALKIYAHSTVPYPTLEYPVIALWLCTCDYPRPTCVKQSTFGCALRLHTILLQVIPSCSKWVWRLKVRICKKQFILSNKSPTLALTEWRMSIGKKWSLFIKDSTVSSNSRWKTILCLYHYHTWASYRFLLLFFCLFVCFLFKEWCTVDSRSRVKNSIPISIAKDSSVRQISLSTLTLIYSSNGYLMDNIAFLIGMVCCEHWLLRGWWELSRVGFTPSSEPLEWGFVQICTLTFRCYLTTSHF